MNRRRVLTLVATGSALGGVVLAGGPGVGALIATGRASGGERWVRTIPFDALAEGEPKRVVVVADERDAWTLSSAQELGTVWLLREGAGVRAFSAACPHLGCAVTAKEGGSGFVCLCHESFFALDGRAQGGPSPRGLDPLATRVEEGIVLVDFRRFRAGTKERVEVG